MTELLNIMQQAGLLIRIADHHGFDVKGSNAREEHLFITAKRSNLEPLFDPHLLLAMKRQPHLLSEGAWNLFAERLTRHEFDAVLAAVKLNREVLDIGSGHRGKSSKTHMFFPKRV